MLSGLGEADELVGVGISPALSLKGVGKNLQDHANCAIMPVLKPEFVTAGLDLQIPWFCQEPACGSGVQPHVFRSAISVDYAGGRWKVWGSREYVLDYFGPDAA